MEVYGHDPALTESEKKDYAQKAALYLARNGKGEPIGLDLARARPAPKADLGARPPDFRTTGVISPPSEPARSTVNDLSGQVESGLLK